MRSIWFIILFLLSGFGFCQVQLNSVWVSQKPGFWNDSTVWTANQVPQISAGDTVKLMHPVVVQSNLELLSNSHIYISANGGLCGHYSLTMQPNSSMDITGILELDSLFLNGARVNSNPGSLVTLHRSARISGQGAIWSIRGIVRVGPWFDCKLPEFAFALSIPSKDEDFSPLQVFPNPAKDKLFIKTQKPGTFNLYDKLGRLHLSKNLDQNETVIQLSTLKSGLFLYTISDESGQSKPMLLQVE